MTTATRVEPDADDLRDVDCDHCCGTGVIYDADAVSGEGGSRCPACRPDEASALARREVSTNRGRASAEGSDSGIRTGPRLASGSRPPRSSSIDPGADVTLEDLRSAVENARASRDGAGTGDVERAAALSSCLISLADRALEYLEAEGIFREASCAVMGGADPENVDFAACVSRVAIAEVALRTVASAGSSSPGKATMVLDVGTCDDLGAPDAPRAGGNVSPSGVVDDRRAITRWWSRLWPKSRGVSVRSGGDLTGGSIP
jgi:hypothetical protein